ncbi:MAG: macrolide family glycosyltransferase, partial [Tumebacillaceae bacterium]
MSKHIAFVNIPAHGHVNPTLAVARELVDRGYRVSYVTTEEFVPAITAAGATPLLYRSAFLEGMKYAKNTPKDPHPAHILHQFLDEMKAGLPQLEALFQHDKPDLLVHDYLAWSAKVFAGKAGIPAIQTNPTFVENEHFSMDKKFAKVQPFHPTIVTFMFKLLFFLNKQKTKALTLGTFFNDPAKTCIAFFPRAFQFEGDTFGERFAFVGPCLTERGFQGTWQPSVEQKPVLLISLGTASKVGSDFYKTCIEAFADSRWHVVMAVGKKIDPASLGALPANVEVHQQVPQLAILPHCEAFLSHG